MALSEVSHPYRNLLLERILKNCDGIMGGININMIRASQLKEIPGLSSEMAEKLIPILIEAIKELKNEIDDIGGYE